MGRSTLDNSKVIQVIITDADGDPAGITVDTTGLATDTGQQEIVDAIESIVIPAPVGVALETTQEDVLASLEAIEAVTTNGAPTLVSRAPYTVARPITPNTNVAAGQAVLISCTVAGNQVLELSSGNTITIPLVVGVAYIDNIAVIDAPSSGTTATATVTVLAVS